MVVDLKHSDPRLLKRFMGKQGYQRFSTYHGLDRQGVPPPDMDAVKTVHDDDQAA